MQLEVISPENFFPKPHWSHYIRQEGKATRELAATAILKEEDINAFEAKNNIKFPHLLRRLYLIQNGGASMDLFAPCDKKMNNAEDGWINVCSGYNDFPPLDRITTLKEHISLYESPEENPKYFPIEAERLFVLVAYYQEVLLLDYRDARSEPEVIFGSIDYDDMHNEPWKEKALVWRDFDTFFAALRRRRSPDADLYD